MANFALTGYLGSGKTLCAVGRIQKYLRDGKKVATNLDLYLDQLLGPQATQTCIRLPDFPKLIDLELIGRGHYVVGESGRPGDYSKNEKHNGLLVLDECNVLFNSREWGDKSRVAVISWLRHSRKMGWDVIFIMQDLDAIDKQMRRGLMEHEGVCKRTDRLSLPFVGGLLRSFGLGFLSRPPRVHVCSVKYGISQHAPVVDRWFYRGVLIQEGYDSNQVFNEETSPAIYSVLPAQTTHGRYLPPPFFERLKMFFNGQVWKSKRPILTSKQKLVARLMKLKDHQKRIEFYKRFQQCGAI